MLISDFYNSYKSSSQHSEKDSILSASKVYKINFIVVAILGLIAGILILYFTGGFHRIEQWTISTFLPPDAIFCSLEGSAALSLLITAIYKGIKLHKRFSAIQGSKISEKDAIKNVTTEDYNTTDECEDQCFGDYGKLDLIYAKSVKQIIFFK